MNITHFRNTIFVAIGLFAFALVLTPTANWHARAQESENTTDQSPYDASALGVVLRANCNEIPASGEELVRVLHSVGDFAQLPVSFSSVSMTSGLLTPRVIIAPRPEKELQPEPDDAKGAKTAPSRTVRSTSHPRPLSTIPLDQPNIEGRLFFAANMEKTNGNLIRVKNIEFISWNSRRKRFDFGVIDYSDSKPEITLLDGVRCFSCHKNKGPILGSGPWSNTTHNEVVRKATLSAMNLGKQTSIALGWNSLKTDITPEEKNPLIALKSQTTFDGMSLVLPEPEAVDAAVRIGSDLVRDRAIYRAMLKSADGRKAFAYLLSAIVDPEPIDKSYQHVKQSLDLAFNANYTNFGNDIVAIHNTSSSTLHDYSPAGSMGVLRTSRGKPAAWGRGSMLPPSTTLVWGGTTEKVIDYNMRRAEGDPAMTSSRQPSSTKAFVHTAAGFPPSPSAAVSALALARVIGLTEADRAFLTQTLEAIARRIGKPKVTAATLAQELFNGSSFVDNWKTGDIPDRDEFKDRCVAGLTAIARSYGICEGVKADRRDFASGPNCLTVPGQEDREPEVIPTTACLRCHDVRGAGKIKFNPIPMLAFNPFDKPGREAWARNADAKQKLTILSLLLKRLETEKDMPPDDSLEHNLFRVKDPISFDSAREFLEVELKKVSEK